MQTNRVLVLGLDGVSFDLLMPLFARKVMPFLSSWLENSYHGELSSTIPPITATAWTSLITGTNPGQHGILQLVSLRPGETVDDHVAGHGAHEVFPGGFSLLNANSIRGTTLWDLLTRAGKRQVAINVPMTYPPRPLDGIMITGMMTPPSAEIYTHPPELSSTLQEAGYEIDLSIAEKEFDFDPAGLIDRLQATLLKRRDVALQLVGEEAWDFFMLVFTGTDRLQHRFWKYLVPGDPQYESPEAVRLRPALDGYFRALDQALAQLIEAAGPETLTILLSDHGFGPVSTRTVHRLSMMRALGLAEGGRPAGIVRLRNLLEGRLGLTPDRLRGLLKPVLPRQWISQVEARARQAQLAAGAGERAYSVTLHEYVGGIYINRERLAVEAGAYEAFRQELCLRLRALVDPDTGQPFVSRVYVREELYSGPAAAECPDVVFYLAPGYGLSGGIGPGGRLVSSRRGNPNKQGTHRDEGVLAIGGPGVTNTAGAQERLLDVTATILYALNLPIPVIMDSRPIVAAFDQQLVTNRPPRYSEEMPPAQDGAAGTPTGESWLSREDEEQLLDRLRALGYVE